MMQLDVKENPPFVASINKNKHALSYWRAQLTRFEKRAHWEFLPHPAQIVIARSKKGRQCLKWMKTHDPVMWEFACKDRRQGLSPGELSQELNRNIEAWLTEFAARLKLKTRGACTRFSDSIGLLMVFGFSKNRMQVEKREEADYECKELLASIQRGENPFNNGRAKYCRPITQEMIRKRIEFWTS